MAEVFFSDRLSELGFESAKLQCFVEKRQQQWPHSSPVAAQLAVARHGELLAHVAFGDADLNKLFCQFSVTKALVASAVWILLEQGKLDLHEAVSRRISEFSSNGKQGITPWHLLTHTAGFPDAPFAALDWPDPGRRLARFESWYLESSPGEKMTYHPESSFWVLAELIERVVAMPYQDFIHQRIIEPLGLDVFLGLPQTENQRTLDMFPVGKPLDPIMAKRMQLRIFEVDEARWPELNRPEWRAVGSPGGGAIGTAAALALFYQAILADLGSHSNGPGIWSTSILKEALRNQTGDLVDPMLGKRACRGLGVVLADDGERAFRGFPTESSTDSFGHMGLGGQVAWADPESGISYAYCTNGANRNPLKQGAEGLGTASQVLQAFGG